MKYSETLKKNDDFREIYRTGKSYANKYLIMYVRKNENDNNRFHIVLKEFAVFLTRS